MFNAHDDETAAPSGRPLADREVLGKAVVVV